MTGGTRAVSENPDLSLTAVGYIYAVDVFVVLYDRLRAGLPEDAVVFLGVGPEKPGVLELHEEA